VVKTEDSWCRKEEEITHRGENFFTEKRTHNNEKEERYVYKIE